MCFPSFQFEEGEEGEEEVRQAAPAAAFSLSGGQAGGRGLRSALPPGGLRLQCGPRREPAPPCLDFDPAISWLKKTHLRKYLYNKPNLLSALRLFQACLKGQKDAQK